ncbi:Amid-like NADH oxidoreductase, putative [Trichophyton verrucosum HKI 0517]|uniref:Amid-like NADH oxidoreductase, putative n=1 Tax=Trichophyton verrucosum (strain HKI 0517) TaxID=663202 RepID=D4D611_TRIVH|nr:Amid-like NADH oxidoreductase, putative [Trichophyton verrucosum HKI 0517]EFE42690.1 Amid-like NADH oxidoreductase, putative [Trichophyton verrucosum HKI 0517]
MLSESLKFYGKGSRAMLSIGLARMYQHIQAIGHRWLYQATPSPKNVVVLGGSYAGIHLAQRLTETLPTGYRAVLIEKNSHFNHLYVFPRFGVVPGMEQSAFIPYTGIASHAPAGIFQHVQDSATSVTGNTIELASGKSINYEYLAIATGSHQPPPARMKSKDKEDACAEMRVIQKQVQNAKRIAVIGGGPVGVQVATDIKSFFPAKNVTLIHSRHQLLPNFGPRLHGHILQRLDRLNIKSILGERPQSTTEAVDGTAPISQELSLRFKNGSEEIYDLVIWCSGQLPNSSILSKCFPSAICKETGQILVHPTLQVNNSPGIGNKHIFALGDVAKTDGPRMGRACQSQAEIVASNILTLIKSQDQLVTYRPSIVDRVIKLTLGKNDYVWYVKDDNGRELMLTGKGGGTDLSVGQAWSKLRVSPRDITGH